MANYETQFFINVIKYVSNISQKAHNGMNLDEQIFQDLLISQSPKLHYFSSWLLDHGMNKYTTTLFMAEYNIPFIQGYF